MFCLPNWKCHSNCFINPKTLGADRLALVAEAVFVFSNKPVLIIDVGTCITFDFVDSKTKHLGGSISPGLQMRLNALSNQTSALPLVNGYLNHKTL